MNDSPERDRTPRPEKPAAGSRPQEDPPKSDPSPLQRLSSILAQDENNPSQPWDMLEDLPEDARQLLESRQPTGAASESEPGSEPDPSAGQHVQADPSRESPGSSQQRSEQSAPETKNPAPDEFSDTISKAESLAQSMRDRGYLIEEDASGIRLSGAPVRRGKQTSIMSASELVELAAEMEGGVVPPDQRLHCPHCDAVIRPGETRCPWCSKDLNEHADAPGETDHQIPPTS